MDDEPFIQRSLSFVFKKEGYEVDNAANGEEALEKARLHKPKIIFLDLMMPKLNGFATCQRIKSDDELKSCYVIILTAKGQESDKERGFEAGADDFLTKPFSPREVIEKVKGVLGST